MGIDGLMEVASREVGRPMETDKMRWALGWKWAEANSGWKYIFRNLLSKLSGETRPSIEELKAEYTELADDCAWMAKTTPDKIEKPWYGGAKRACERILSILNDMEAKG